MFSKKEKNYTIIVLDKNFISYICCIIFSFNSFGLFIFIFVIFLGDVSCIDLLTILNLIHEFIGFVGDVSCIV